MATTTTEILSEHWHEQEPRFANGGTPKADPELALAPLVDKIAYGLARVLVVAMKELETHIASETRKVSDSVGRQLDTLQAGFQDLSGVVSEQRSMSLAVQDKCRELTDATRLLEESDTRQAADLSALRQDTGGRLDTLQESDTRRQTELSALRTEAKEFSTSVSEKIDGLCKELGVQQEDIATMKTLFAEFCSRVDTVAERLDRQAESLRSIYATYAQRETELEQLVNGLARLRAYPAPKSVTAL